MGLRFSPGMANVYLIDFDAKAISYVINPINYRRFLDDIFFVWPGSIEQLTTFQDYLNTIEPGIHVTFSYHKTRINFLDVTVFKHIENNGLITLQTMPYFKPTDSHQLLHKSSFHPRHTTRGILKSQLLRFKRLSSFRVHYNEACNTLFKVLRSRGYSHRLL